MISSEIRYHGGRILQHTKAQSLRHLRIHSTPVGSTRIYSTDLLPTQHVPTFQVADTAGTTAFAVAARNTVREFEEGLEKMEASNQQCLDNIEQMLQVLVRRSGSEQLSGYH